MPKLIPEGGKRDIQIKVHLNKPEKHNLENLASFYGTSDRASAIRKLLSNWVNLHQYVSSFNEIVFIAQDIYKNKEDLKLPKSTTRKVLDIINIGEKLSEIASEKNDSSNENFSKKELIDKFDNKVNNKKSKIVFLKIYELIHAYNVLDHLMKGSNVICYFTNKNLIDLEQTSLFESLLRGVSALNAKIEKLSPYSYLFSPENTNIEKESFEKFSDDEIFRKEADNNINSIQKDGAITLEKSDFNTYGPSPKRYNLNDNLCQIKEKLKNEKELNKFSSFKEKNKEQFYLMGLQKYEKGLYQESIENFNEVIFLDPKYIEAYIYRGNAKLELQN